MPEHTIPEFTYETEMGTATLTAIWSGHLLFSLDEPVTIYGIEYEVKFDRAWDSYNEMYRAWVDRSRRTDDGSGTTSAAHKVIRAALDPVIDSISPDDIRTLRFYAFGKWVRMACNQIADIRTELDEYESRLHDLPLSEHDGYSKTNVKLLETVSRLYLRY